MRHRTYSVDVPVGDKPTEQCMFEVAISFHEAAIRCAEPVVHPDGTTTSPSSPMIACYALAVELYLKSLMVLDHGREMQGHRLNVLFARLAESSRADIAAKVQFGAAPVSADELLSILQELGAAFVEWRYIYELEGGRHIQVDILISIAQALYKSIRNRCPAWEVEPYLDGRMLAPPKTNIAFIVTGTGGTIVQGVYKATSASEAGPPQGPR